MSSNKSSMKKVCNRIKRKSTGSRTCNVKFIDGNDPSSYAFPIGEDDIFICRGKKYYEDVPPPRPPSLTKKISEPCLTKKLSEPLLTKKLSERIIKFVK